MKWYDIYNWNGSQSSIVKFQIKVYVSAFIVGLIVAWALQLFEPSIFIMLQRFD